MPDLQSICKLLHFGLQWKIAIYYLLSITCSPFLISIVGEITLCLGGKQNLLPKLKAENLDAHFSHCLWEVSTTTISLGYSVAPALNFDAEKQGGSGWWLSQQQHWVSRTSSFWFFSGILKCPEAMTVEPDVLSILLKLSCPPKCPQLDPLFILLTGSTLLKFIGQSIRRKKKHSVFQAWWSGGI